MPSSSPHTPQSQPQASRPANTATGFMRLARLVNHGVMRLPTMVWMMSEALPTASAMFSEPNCRKPTNADAAAVAMEPT